MGGTRRDLFIRPWPSRTATGIRYFVIAGVTAGLAVHETVGAETNVDLRLAEDAVFIAGAVRLGLLTLRANNVAGLLGGHGSSVDRVGDGENVTEVMGGERFEVRGQTLRVHGRW